MKENSVAVKCVFAEDGDLQKILLNYFRLYIQSIFCKEGF